jgi:hypothetical protein
MKKTTTITYEKNNNKVFKKKKSSFQNHIIDKEKDKNLLGKFSNRFLSSSI